MYSRLPRAAAAGPRVQWDGASASTSVRVRVSKHLPGPQQGPTIVMEAAPGAAAGRGEGEAASGPVAWRQVRIASLRGSGAAARPWGFGVFSISPIRQSGSWARV